MRIAIRQAVRTAALTLTLAAASSAQGWLVSPSRQELNLHPGDSRTFAVRVERESGKGPAEAVRFTATPSDWDISRSGDVELGNAGSLPHSANAWMTYTPATFPLNADGYNHVRVTISVPRGTAPGVYRAGLFFEEHSAVPEAASGTRRMVLRYRLSTLIYVVVGGTHKAIEVEDVAVSGSREEGLALTAVLDNTGTMHLRPEHWMEITDGEGKVLFKSERLPTMVLLPQHQLDVRLSVPRDKLPAASGYNVRYIVDADKELPLKASTVSVVSKP
jgi:hypothetical protein